MGREGISRALGLALAAASLSWFAPTSAHASPELDRQFSLRTVGVLRSWDNVDGLFNEYVTGAFKEWLQSNSRFTFVDVTRADTLLQGSKLSYLKLLDDREVLGQVAKAIHADTLVRTKVWKEGPRYRFKIDWLHAPKMDLLASETVLLDEPSDGKPFSVDDLRKRLNEGLERLIRQLPYVATVNGRDAKEVTIDVGRSGGIRKGDTLVFATVEEAKMHPLLGALVDWRTHETGRAVVETVEDGLSFARLTEEEPGRTVARLQKVVKVLPAPEPEASASVNDAEERARALLQPGKLGWAGASLWSGLMSRQYATSSAAVAGRSGSSLLFGARVDGQLWIDSRWSADLSFAYGLSSYSQSDIASGSASPAQGVGATVTHTRLGAGYSFLASPEAEGPKGNFRFGWQSIGYSMPVATADGMGPAGYSGLFVGLSGDLPMRGRWKALLNVDFGVFDSVTANQVISSNSTGSSMINFYLGTQMQWKPRLKLRAGLDLQAQGADFADGSVLSHKVVTFGPSLLYSF